MLSQVGQRQKNGAAARRQRLFQRLPVPTPVAAIRPVEVPVHVMAIEALAEAVVHAYRLEAVPEAARLGRLNEGHTGDCNSCQRAKNKPHDTNLPGCNSPQNTAGGTKNLIRT